MQTKDPSLVWVSGTGTVKKLLTSDGDYIDLGSECSRRREYLKDGRDTLRLPKNTKRAPL